MSLSILNLLNQPSADTRGSFTLMFISLIVTFAVVYAFKIFIAKSQNDFREKFEDEGYEFDKSWKFPAGIVEIDTSKRVLWVSTHGKKLINIDDIKEMKLFKTSFETSNIYIKTNKELLKYPISSGRRMSKTKLNEQNKYIDQQFDEVKNFVFGEKEIN